MQKKMQFLLLVHISFLGNCFQAVLLMMRTKSKLILGFEITWQFFLSCFKALTSGLNQSGWCFLCSNSSGKQPHAGVSGLKVQGLLEQD